MGGALNRFPTVAALAWLMVVGGVTPAVATPSTPMASPQPEVAALLARAATTMSAVRSYQFRLTYEEGETTLYKRITMRKAHGEVERPDRFKATVEAKLGPVGVDVDVINVGQRLWVELAGVNGEIDIDENVARVLFDPTSILIGAVEALRQPRLLGMDELDGVPVTWIAGTVDPSRLDAGSANPVVTSTTPSPVELAIDKQGHVLSLRLTGPLIAADSDDVVRRLDLSGFDEPVEIEAPNE